MTVVDHGGLMDRVYRHQRYIYDATRKYYLLGRDPMIAGLNPPPGASVLEIGCGTGRNLVKAARRYPRASFYGIDISREMLETAGRSIAGAGLTDRVRLAFADRGKVGLFLDIYNALNADTLVNINWRSGASFERATTVVGPRILKFGVKFDW